MEKYILISIIILIVILIIIYFVHKKMSENFESEQISNYNILDDLLFRKSKNLDIVEKNAYMDSPVIDIVNTDYLHEFKFLGPAWEGEFMYDNPDEMQMNYRRDKLLENLNQIGIGAGLVHLPNDIYSAFKEFRTDLPETRKFEARQISLPCGWWLKESECEKIASKVLELLKI